MAPKFKAAAIGEQCYRCDTIMDEDCESVGGAFHCWSCADFLKRISDYHNAIQRVRELANWFADYKYEIDELEKTYSGKIVQKLIIQALDGEQ